MLSDVRLVLVDRLFVGNYVERRYVEALKEYRDLIRISPAETDLIKDIQEIVGKLVGVSGVQWLGITAPGYDAVPSGYHFWVKLHNIPFGQFWFQIKGIECEKGEIIFDLKCIRALKPEDLEDTTRIPSQENNNNFQDESEYSFNFDPAEKLAALYMCLFDTVQHLWLKLTWCNFIIFSRLLILMVTVMVTVMLTCIQHLGIFTLRLLRELSFLMQSISPILLQVIDCVTKIIGGFFILIAMIFRPQPSPTVRNEFQAQERYPMLHGPRPAPGLRSREYIHK